MDALKLLKPIMLYNLELIIHYKLHTSAEGCDDDEELMASTDWVIATLLNIHMFTCVIFFFSYNMKWELNSPFNFHH